MLKSYFKNLNQGFVFFFKCVQKIIDPVLKNVNHVIPKCIKHLKNLNCILKTVDMYIRKNCTRYIPKMCIEKQWEPEIKQKKTN